MFSRVLNYLSSFIFWFGPKRKLWWSCIVHSEGHSFFWVIYIVFFSVSLRTYSKCRQIFFSDSYCVAFFYLTSRTTLHSHCFAWRQAKQRSPTFQFVVTRGPRDLVESIAVNVKLLFTVRNGNGFLGHPDTRHTKKNTWLYVDVLLVKLKTLYFEYFLSDHLQCETSYHTPYTSICPTNKNHTSSYWANEEATFLCLLFY